MINYEVMSVEDMNKCIELAANAYQDYEYYTYYMPEQTRIPNSN